ncbi:MAG: NAD-dependent epimerase/dehydratase family protein, partial [Lachnospiraceae bacterium]|nr:NAD-dependent epimerase/dehydratase family protein [Lachnospiraceae bacterium]
MKIWEHPLYIEDLQRTAALPLPWKQLQEATVLLSGGSGLIGSFLTDLIMYKNRMDGLDCHITVMGRNLDKLRNRFAAYEGDPLLQILQQDVNSPIAPKVRNQKIDYLFHLASNTHPLQYATDPIGTVTTNIIGTNNLLELGAEAGVRRFVFASSVEVYGENRGDCEYFKEDYCGYIDCNTMRAGYPESKRAGEALCQAYIKQKGMDIVIPRLSRTYGPSMLQSDSKAISQFIKKGVALRRRRAG